MEQQIIPASPTGLAANVSPEELAKLIAMMNKKQSAPDKPETVVVREFYKAHELLYVQSADLFYYKDDDIYHRLNDDNLMVWVRDQWEDLLNDNWTANEIDRAIAKVKKGVRNRIGAMEKRLVKIGKGLFWDVAECEFHTEVPEGHNCFAKLFDSDEQDNSTTLVPSLTDEQLGVIRGQHDKVLKAMQENETLTEEYDFVTTWACEDHDVYMDMLRCHALSFMPPTKVGSPILIGQAGNGKSTYLDLLHTIWGRNNTTQLTMKQMADKHHQLRLAYSFMNAPDEEQEYKDSERDEVQRVFKTLSARSSLAAEKMFSQEDVKLKGDFVSYFPMNHKPTWRGTSAKALVRRSLIIPFYADLSHNAYSGRDFFHETFTPDMLCHYLGTLLGLASFYKNHDMKPSPAMAAQQDTLLAETDSTVSYKKEFELFFDSFQTFETLANDYKNWCRIRDFHPQPDEALKWTFGPYLEGNRYKCRKEFACYEGGKRVQPLVYRAQVLKDHAPLLDHFYYPDIGRIDKLHSKELNLSIVEKKAEQARETYGEQYYEILSRQIRPMGRPKKEPEQIKLGEE